MTNNDVLRRVRYALRLNDFTMIKIFKLGGVTLTNSDISALLAKEEDENIEQKRCNNHLLNSFLNGLIIYKRGKQENSSELKEKVENKTLNNLILKKLKIALQFRSEDMQEAFKIGGIDISNSELSAIFRREEHKNHRVAGDKYVRVFLKGITKLFRER